MYPSSAVCPVWSTRGFTSLKVVPVVCLAALEADAMAGFWGSPSDAAV